MQSKKYISFLFTILLIACCPGCTKTAVGTTGPAGPTGAAGANGGSITPSAITGFVELYNQYGYPDTSNAGVGLSTFKGDTLVTAITDISGEFSLGPLPPGNYDIHFTKPGYDSLKVFVQHSGGDDPKFIGDVRMDAGLTSKITNETLNIQKFFGDNILFVNLTFSGSPATFLTLTNFNFYFSRSKNLSTANYEVMTPGNNEVTGNNNYQLQYDLTNISYAGIHYSLGDTVYIKTVISPVPNSVTSWFDYATYKTVNYPYLGDSVENYFIWPN